MGQSLCLLSSAGGGGRFSAFAEQALPDGGGWV